VVVADAGCGGANRRARLMMDRIHRGLMALANCPVAVRRSFGVCGGVTGFTRRGPRGSFEPEVGLSVTARRCRADSSWSGTVGVFMGPVYAMACGALHTTPKVLRFRGCRRTKRTARRSGDWRAVCVCGELRLVAVGWVEAVDIGLRRRFKEPILAV